MDTLDFLQRVLPTEGHYVIAVEEDGRIQHKFFSTVDELATTCISASAEGYNTYYAISSFAEPTRRTQANVLLTRVIAMDVDCGEGKPYVDQKEGLQAFLTFMQTTGLPRPMVVSSGRGLHIYWLLSKQLEPARWQPMADAMKALALNNEFHIDPAITADSARILRPTQTINPKSRTVVDVLLDAPACDVQVLQNLLGNVQPANVTQSVTQASAPKGFAAHRQSRMVGSMQADDEFPPKNPQTIVAKCKQVRWAIENQDKVEEPFWYALMGIAAYCVDPEATAVAWSNQYPGYDETETLKKVNQWKGVVTGPTTCKRFQELKPKGCANCPLKDKIKTPAAIGALYQETQAAPEVDTTVPLPKPFKRAKHPKGHDIIVMAVDGTDVEVAPFDIYPTGYGMDHGLGYETVRYRWNRPHVGWQDISLRQAYLNEGDRQFGTSLADQGIVVGGIKQQETFRFMLRSYMDQLRSIKAMTSLHGTMGWKEGNSQFVVGTNLYKHEGGTCVQEQVPVAAGTQRQTAEYYQQAGSLADWVTATGLFDALPEYGFALGVSLAAPLVEFTGLKGAVLSLVGETGAGKTLCQLVQQSVWGVPGELHFNAEYTQAALFGRLGFYANLPMTVDETTLMRDEDVGRFVMWATQGKDRARLDRNANEREPKKWATTVTVSTNKSMVAKLTSSGHETTAQMARMVELSMPYRHQFKKGTAFGQRVHDLFCENYGWAGDAILKEYLRIGPEGLKARVKRHSTEFEKKYNIHFAGNERFWKMLYVLADLALEIAEEIGLIRFDRVAVVQHALQDVVGMRRSMEDTEFDAFDLITEYLRKYADEMMTVMHTEGGTSSLDTSRQPRGEVRARLDLYRKSAVEDFDHGTVMIVTSPFKRWLAEQGHDIRAIKREVRANAADATPASGRFWFGRDTSIRYGQYYCMGVLLTHKRMAGFMADQQQSAEDLTFGQLKEV